MLRLVGVGFACVIASSLAVAQQATRQPTTAADAASRDTSYIDADGTAHVTRVIPVPKDLSPEAQKFISHQLPDEGPPQSLAGSAQGCWMRGRFARVQSGARSARRRLRRRTIGGVPVHVVTPENMPAGNRDKVLINLHGGGFNGDSGSYSESIPIASYTGMKVVAVLYRLAPENPFPAGVDDAIAVYKELLKTYKPDHVVIYGTSAGATMTAEVAVKLEAAGITAACCAGNIQRAGYV